MSALELKHFDEGEFDCPCCGKNEMDPRFLKRLDGARDKAGTPFAITSGYRCEKHNKDVGGTEGSSHPKGCAADIFVDGSRWRFFIVWALLHVGFHRIGIGDEFIHVDADTEKDPNVIWVY